MIDDVIVTRPGPRIGEGLKILAEAIHPGGLLDLGRHDRTGAGSRAGEPAPDAARARAPAPRSRQESRLWP